MSYNIDTWKTKKLNGLMIPLSELYSDRIRSDWRLENPTLDPDDEENTEIYLCEQGTIRGKIIGGEILALEIDCAGACSGTIFNMILEPALKHSKGELEAVLVWEGGDSITRLTVKDGHVKTEPIDL